MNPTPEEENKPPAPSPATPAAKGKAKKKRKPHWFRRVTPRELDRRLAVKGRLPHGAEYEVRFDIRSETWSGCLRLPLPDGIWRTFSGCHAGVFRLLNALDDQYRAALVEANAAAAALAPAKGGAA